MLSLQWDRHYASTDKDLKAQSSRTLKALFLKVYFRVKEVVLVKFVTFVKKKNNKIILFTSVILQNSMVKKRAEKKAVKLVASQQDLRPDY